MGTVYACRHVVVGKVAAMKVLRTGSDRTESVLQRFVQEAKTANLLRSRHIAEVSDFGQLPSGSLFVVMELLEGQDLAHAMRKSQEDHGGLGRRELVHIFTQVAETLQLAHDKGIVHRDLKPDNVFLVREGDDPLLRQAARLRHRQDPARRRQQRAHRDGRRPRHAVLHVARAGARRRPRSPERRLLARRDDVPRVHGPPPLRRRLDDGRAHPPHHRGAAAAQPDQQRRSGHRAAHPALHGQAPRVPLPEHERAVRGAQVRAPRARSGAPRATDGLRGPRAPPSYANHPRGSSGALPAAANPTAAATPQAVAYAASGHAPQVPGGPYAQAPSGPYAQAASGPYAARERSPRPQARQRPLRPGPSGPYAQAPSGPYPQAYAGPQAPPPPSWSASCPAPPRPAR